MLCTIESGDMACAADECVCLLESFMAPRCFWPTLLTHVKRIADSLLLHAQSENDNELSANGAKVCVTLCNVFFIVKDIPKNLMNYVE